MTGQLPGHYLDDHHTVYRRDSRQPLCSLGLLLALLFEPDAMVPDTLAPFSEALGAGYAHAYRLRAPYLQQPAKNDLVPAAESAAATAAAAAAAAAATSIAANGNQPGGLVHPQNPMYFSVTF